MFILITIITILIYGPISTFLHELGHAIPVLLFSDNDVIVSIGPDRKHLKSISIGRLKINIKGFSPIFGSCYYYGELSRSKKILCYLGGPFVSLIGLLLATIFLLDINGFVLGAVLNTIWNFELARVIITLLPITYNFGEYKGHSSDGKKLLKLIKEKPQSE